MLMKGLIEKKMTHLIKKYLLNYMLILKQTDKLYLTNKNKTILIAIKMAITCKVKTIPE